MSATPTKFTRVKADEVDATVLKQNGTVVGAGSGDVTGQSASVDGEVALFSGTGGKTIKRATGSGLAKLTSGVLGMATAGTDYLSPNSSAVDVQVKSVNVGAGGAVTLIKKGTISIDLGTPAVNSGPISVQVTIAGAAVGDAVILIPQSAILTGAGPAGGLIIEGAYVSAPDTVQLVIYPSFGGTAVGSKSFVYLIVR